MRIAVDTRSIEGVQMPEIRAFIEEVFVRIAKEHPGSQLIFFTNSASTVLTNLPENTTVVAVKSAASTFFLGKWVNEVKLSLALKKSKAEVFVTPNLLIHFTSVPQIQVLRHLNVTGKKNFFSNNSDLFSKRAVTQLTKKAKAVVTLSQFTKDQLVNRYQLKKDFIEVIDVAAAEVYKPVSWDEKEQLKQQFAGGCEYFVVYSSRYESNILPALKAFSIFKKWQKTNMKLLIAGNFDEASKKELQKLSTYKYRNDVIVRDELPTVKKPAVIAASYAIIYPSLNNGFALPVLEALQSGVPVITSPNGSMSEVADTAALYADITKAEEIAAQMKMIFKDEQLRSKLVEAGIERAKLYNWNKTISLFWRVIEQAVSR